MASSFGERLRVSLFGESHGNGIGALLDGLPAGEAIDTDALLQFMARRQGGRAGTTPRKEPDIPEFVSGVTNGRTNGFPLCIRIANTNVRSGDYNNLADTPRPSHADYTAYVKWHGNADMRGGGHFSGRLTAPLCAAGGIAKQILARRGIFVGAHLASVGKVTDEAFPLNPDPALFDDIAQRDFPAVSSDAGRRMQEEIAKAAADLDSVGGRIECMITGLPAGLGDPMFDGIESRLARAVFGIPAVKGLVFGEEHHIFSMRGSEANDPFMLDAQGNVRTASNRNGGIQGGITNGMPVVFCVSMKPTPSVGLPQQSVSLSEKREMMLEIRGRHDPCVAVRAVPVMEAAAALVALDTILIGNPC